MAKCCKPPNLAAMRRSARLTRQATREANQAVRDLKGVSARGSLVTPNVRGTLISGSGAKPCCGDGKPKKPRIKKPRGILQ